MSNSAEMMATRDDSQLVLRLLTDALSSFDKDRMAARKYVEDAHALAQAQNSADAGESGGLAPWQVNRAKKYVKENIELKIRGDDVAALLRISPSHFSRGFKASTGTGFLKFVLRERVGLAKRLLLDTSMPLCQIALKCGCADQSHLTRLFTRIAGTPPNKWRRNVNSLKIFSTLQTDDFGAHLFVGSVEDAQDAVNCE